MSNWEIAAWVIGLGVGAWLFIAVLWGLALGAIGSVALGAAESKRTDATPNESPK